MTTLGEFLRARREQIRPGDVGMPDSGRRRTPGLRREEVATLAGVSVDYLVRLEQGRDTNPSPSVLAALADALLLSDEERHCLGQTAAVGHSRNLCNMGGVPDDEVAPTVRTLLEQLDPSPSFVTGPFEDVLAWNTSWELLVAPIGMLDDEQPNLARHLFLHPQGHSTRVDWDAEADRTVGRLRTAAMQWDDDDRFASLLEELHGVDAFARRWSAHVPGNGRRGTTTLVHPDAGDLHLSFEVLDLPDCDHRLVCWLPVDDTAAAALAHALDRPEAPTQLRSIS